MVISPHNITTYVFFFSQSSGFFEGGGLVGSTPTLPEARQEHTYIYNPTYSRYLYDRGNVIHRI
jgi:hypothetical protein